MNSMIPGERGSEMYSQKDISKESLWQLDRTDRRMCKKPALSEINQFAMIFELCHFHIRTGILLFNNIFIC